MARFCDHCFMIFALLFNSSDRFIPEAQAANRVFNNSSANYSIKIIHNLKAEAKNFCSAPKMYGMKKSVSGKFTGSVSVSKLTKIIANPNFSATAVGKYETYFGVAQQQLKDALNDSNNCRLKSFEVFEILYLKLSKNAQLSQITRNRNSEVGKKGTVEDESRCRNPLLSVRGSQNAAITDNLFIDSSNCQVDAQSSSNMQYNHNKNIDILPPTPASSAP